MKKRIKENFKGFKLIKEDRDNFYYKAKKGPSHITKIPKTINKNLCCYVGLIIGDGHLRKDINRISIELTDKELLEGIKDLTKEIFDIELNIKSRQDKRLNRKRYYYLQMNNAMVHMLLNKIFEIPSGKKSNIVKIPPLLKDSNKEFTSSLLIGLLASDGGARKRSREIRLTSASKDLRDDICYILKSFNIKYRMDQWINQKYKKTYYGLCFTNKYLECIMRGYQSGQMGQIATSLIKKLQGQA